MNENIGGGGDASNSVPHKDQQRGDDQKQVDTPSTSSSDVSPPFNSPYDNHSGSRDNQSGSSTSSPDMSSMLAHQTRHLFSHFMQERAVLDNHPNAHVIRDAAVQNGLGELPDLGFSDETLSNIAVTLRSIGDDISADAWINSLLDQLPASKSKETFWKICSQVFEDGNFSWGRIVAVFFFGYRMLLRMIEDGLDAVPWFKSVISWVSGYIVKQVGRWIVGRGGWQMVREWLGANSVAFSTLIGLTVGLFVFSLVKK